MKIKNLLLKFAACLSLLGMVATAYGQNYAAKNKRTGQEFHTVQEGIESMWSGDVLIVYPGTWDVNLTEDKHAGTITSKYYEDGDEKWIKQTILNGGNNGPIYKYDFHESQFSTIPVKITFKGLTLKGGSPAEGSKGSVISAWRASGEEIQLNIDNCIITENTVSDAVQLFPNETKLSITNSKISKTTGNGACIKNICHGTTISNCRIFNNTTTTVFNFEGLNKPLPNNLNNNLIFNNTVEKLIEAENKEININHNTITSNTVSGKLIDIVNGGLKNVTITNSIFWSNGTKTISASNTILSISHSLVDGGQNSILTSGGTFEHEAMISADPKFWDPVNYNFNLKKLSPCCRFATITDLDKDLRGNTRPNLETEGTFPEIGALENANNNADKAYYNNTFYTSVQQAINDVPNGATSHVYILPGVHKEKPSITNKTGRIYLLQFASALGLINRGNYQTLPGQLKELYIFDGSNNGSALKVENVEKLHIVGFTFQNGKATIGGGVSALGANYLEIDQCLFKSNFVSNCGAGLAAVADILSVSSSQFEENTTYVGQGGGIYAEADDFDVKFTIFRGNSARYGSASVNSKTGADERYNYIECIDNDGFTTIYSESANRFKLLNSKLTDNTSLYEHISMFQANEAEISRSIFEGNNGTIIEFDNYNSVEKATISNCLFRNNKVKENLILSENTDLDILYTSIYDNIYQYSYSNAILMRSSGNTFNCKNSIIYDEDAKYQASFAGSNYTAINFTNSDILNGPSSIYASYAWSAFNYDSKTMISEDPLFEEDGKLQDNSPCLGAGITLTTNEYDLEYTKRENYLTPGVTDMGAYENISDNYAAQILSTGVYYPTIQDAITAAAQNETIIVMPGEHKEFLNLGSKVLTIGSKYLSDNDEQWVEKTVITGERSRNILKANGKGAIFTGLTFVDGASSTTATNDYCFNLGYYTASSIIRPAFKFNKCVIESCQSRYNHMIFAKNASLYFTDCNISKNRAGNAIFGIGYLADISINRSKLLTNSAKQLILTDNSCSSTRYATLKNSLFSGNSIREELFVATLTVQTVINHCTFTNNRIGERLIFAGSDNRGFTFINNIVYNNTKNEIVLSEAGNKILKNNIIAGGESNIINNATGTVTISDIYDADPLFESPSAYDFRIKAGSPAIGSGLVSSHNTSYDIKNNTRDPQSVDLGCYVAGATVKSGKDEDAVDPEEQTIIPSAVKAFPLPMQSTLTIKGDDVVSVSIYDINGVLCTSSTEKVIAVSGLKKGVYVITIQLANGQIKTIQTVK